MLKIALRGLKGRLGRIALSAGAVVLGVAFISGVEMLSDTIQRSADELIDSSLSTNGSVVRSTSTQQSAGAIVRQTVPNELLDQVRSIPGVRTAEGAVQGFGRLIGDDNEPVDPGPVPTFIFNWVDDPALATGRLKDGRPPEADDEIVIDARTAADENWALGDEVRMQSSAGVRSFTVTGIGSLGGGDTSTGVRLVMLDTETAQVFTGSDGQYSYILVAPTDGVSPDSLTDALTAGLPPGVEAITGAAFVEETSNQASQSLVLITRFCQAFGVIGLIVAGLTIANTFSILVAQRTRELALLRVAGASSRQIVSRKPPLSVWSDRLSVWLQGSAGPGSLRMPSPRSSPSTPRCPRSRSGRLHGVWRSAPSRR